MTLAERLAHEAPPGITLRPETDRDVPFLERLYASTRADEMAHVPWPPDTIAAFLQSQCALQRAHYQAHYAGALLLLIERDHAPMGRLYLHESPAEVRVMDIAVLPEWRGQGLGTTLIRSVLDAAREGDARVTLHVEPGNPAQRLYARLGFRLVEQRGVYDFLEWLPPRHLDALTAGDFEAAGDGGFMLRHDAGEPMTLRVESVSHRPSARPQGREGFSIVFTGAASPVLPQRIYRVEHDALGVMELFLVPIGQGPSGVRYEAVFG